MVMEVVQEDMDESNIHCRTHPHKNSTPGGICALCLQEKLGKLVSSSFPIAVFPASSSSSSPSFRSDCGVGGGGSFNGSSSTINRSDSYNGDLRRHRMSSFLLTQKKTKKKNDVSMAAALNHPSVVFKRSKSTVTLRSHVGFSETDYSPRKKGFWSFLYQSKHSSAASSTVGSVSQQRPREEIVASAADENESPGGVSFDRKVSRSRSVGCGSRSFSGDLFDRISTGFGDCTLRRVESQREGKHKVAAARGGGDPDSMKERVKCGGIFGGFMITSSSSSSSSSSNWVSSSTENNSNSRTRLAPAPERPVSHGNSKSWGWALASPIRAFSKPSSSSSSNRKREASKKKVTPNLAAIPSLLAVGG